MTNLSLFGIALVVLAVLWFVGKFLQKREQGAAREKVTAKLKDGAPPDDVYPLW